MFKRFGFAYFGPRGQLIAEDMSARPITPEPPL